MPKCGAGTSREIDDHVQRYLERLIPEKQRILETLFLRGHAIQNNNLVLLPRPPLRRGAQQSSSRVSSSEEESLASTVSKAFVLVGQTPDSQRPQSHRDDAPPFPVLETPLTDMTDMTVTWNVKEHSEGIKRIHELEAVLTYLDADINRILFSSQCKHERSNDVVAI
jgi:hypothetical protein